MKLFYPHLLNLFIWPVLRSVAFEFLTRAWSRNVCTQYNGLPFLRDQCRLEGMLNSERRMRSTLAEEESSCFCSAPSLDDPAPSRVLPAWAVKVWDGATGELLCADARQAKKGSAAKPNELVCMCLGTRGRKTIVGDANGCIKVRCSDVEATSVFADCDHYRAITGISLSRTRRERYCD